MEYIWENKLATLLYHYFAKALRIHLYASSSRLRHSLAIEKQKQPTELSTRVANSAKRFSHSTNLLTLFTVLHQLFASIILYILTCITRLQGIKHGAIKQILDYN